MKHEKYTYSQYQINELNLWRNYLQENEAILQEKFEKIINYFSKRNRDNLSKEELKIIELEFFHGSGQLDFVFSAKTADEDDIYPLFGHEHLVPEYNWYQPKQNNFEYPESLDIYFEDFRNNRAYSEKWHLTFDWLIKNWINLNGHHLGFVCGTWQNNAASTFSFNLLNWDDCIDLSQPELNKEFKYPFKRNLTAFELESRVRFTSYQPFIQKFRYFENANETFYEIGYYANIVGHRTGQKSDYTKKPFEIKESEYEYRTMRFNQYIEIAKKADELLSIGFEEKVKPEDTIKLKENLIEWEYGPFLGEFEPISETSLLKLESYLENSLPSDYEWFLLKMNNIKPVWEISNFRIKHQVWKKFESIFNIKELRVYHELLLNENKITKEQLPIAKDTDGGYVLIHLESKNVFYLKEDILKTHEAFDDFIQDCTSISEYFNPMRYHLEQDNINMLRKWISSGIDLTDESNFGGRKPIQISKNYDITEMLCQHGANPNDFHLFSEMGPKYIKMLINYGLDLNSKLDQQEWFKKVIEENEIYIEIKELLKE